MMSSPPLTPLDLAGLSISSQRNDTYDSHPQGFYSTAPSSAPYVQQPYDNHQQGHFNTTIASMASKSRGGLPTVRSFSCKIKPAILCTLLVKAPPINYLRMNFASLFLPDGSLMFSTGSTNNPREHRRSRMGDPSPHQQIRVVRLRTLSYQDPLVLVDTLSMGLSGSSPAKWAATTTLFRPRSSSKTSHSASGAKHYSRSLCVSCVLELSSPVFHVPRSGFSDAKCLCLPS
jgi:hypothetical protein